MFKIDKKYDMIVSESIKLSKMIVYGIVAHGTHA
jgi:hypothetical protein